MQIQPIQKGKQICVLQKSQLESQTGSGFVKPT